MNTAKMCVVALALVASGAGAQEMKIVLTKDVDLTVSVFQNKGHNVEPGDKHYCVDIRRKPIPPVMAI